MNVRPPKAGFDMRFSKQMVLASMDAYRSAVFLGSICQRWNCEDIQLISDTTTDTQCLAIHGDKKIILAFRGTSSLRDLFIDFTAVKANFMGCYVHKGFLESWRSIKQKVSDFVHSKKPDSIYITGHSLGGALANHAALHLSDNSRRQVFLYTYGSPRVGSSKFASLMNSIVRNHWRVVHSNDAVPFVPLFFRTNLFLPERLPLIPIVTSRLKHAGKQHRLKEPGGKWYSELPIDFGTDHLLQGYSKAHLS